MQRGCPWGCDTATECLHYIHTTFKHIVFPMPNDIFYSVIKKVATNEVNQYISYVIFNDHVQVSFLAIAPILFYLEWEVEKNLKHIFMPTHSYCFSSFNGLSGQSSRLKLRIYSSIFHLLIFLQRAYPSSAGWAACMSLLIHAFILLFMVPTRGGGDP